MSTVWHIVKKDFQRFRWVLLALALIWVFKAGVLMDFYQHPGYDWNTPPRPYALNSGSVAYRSISSVENLGGKISSGFFQVVSYLDVFLLLYLVIQSLRADSAFDERAFWRTRPVSRAQMLAAKTLFLGLSLGAVPLILQISVDVYSMPLFRSLDYYFSGSSRIYYAVHWYDGIFDFLVGQANWVLLGVLVASLWRRPLWGFVALLFLGFCALTIMENFRQKTGETVNLFFAVQTFWLCGCGVIFCATYLCGDRKFGYAVLALGFVFTLLLPLLP